MYRASSESLRDNLRRVRAASSWSWKQVWKHNGGNGMQYVRTVGRAVDSRCFRLREEETYQRGLEEVLKSIGTSG